MVTFLIVAAAALLLGLGAVPIVHEMRMRTPLTRPQRQSPLDATDRAQLVRLAEMRHLDRP